MKLLRAWLEYFGGSLDDPPPAFPRRAGWLILGAWWSLLLALIALFCGQSSRFIYIDF